ncbi:MAG: ABC transporter permease, partial [Pseudomonadota bacterium]
MFAPFERLVALRYLRARRREGFISIIAGFSFLGIALGVATLIIVMAVMNGFRIELVARILGLNGHVSVYGIAGGLPDDTPLKDAISEIDGVVTVTPIIEGQALVSHRGTATGAAVRGVDPAFFVQRPAVRENLAMLGDDSFDREDVIAIGRRMAQRLGVSIGDQLTLIAPEGSATAFGTIPRMRGYEIAAIFEVGMFEYDSGFVYMPIETAQRFFRLPDQITALEIFLDNPDSLGSAKRLLEPL